MCKCALTYTRSFCTQNLIRRQNIPGYTGHVHWTNVAPAHSDMPLPEPTTSARIHRYM